VTSDSNPVALTFRCPPELEHVLPRPVPAGSCMPEWIRQMPAQAFNTLISQDDQTVKRCPPFIDAMTAGILIPLICDLKIDNGEMIWDNEFPAHGSLYFPRSPVGIHDSSQVAGTPLYDANRFLVKFHNLWTIEAPPGYSLLFTHPFNRFDLPFTTLTGIVDCDRYHDNWIHFPAHWHDTTFNGTLSKGTPVAQCLPVRRERLEIKTAAFSEEETNRVLQLTSEIEREKGIYRRRFRA
jgi:hypothetical protein